MQVTKIRSTVPLVKVLEIIQRKRPQESCDTHLMCLDGYIPCHRFILMANCPFLKELILENIKDAGNPDSKTIISMSFPDIKTAHMAQVISMFYTGIAICKLDDLYYVMNILKLIGIDFGNMDKSQLTNATKEEIKAYCKPRYYIDPDSESDDENDSPKNNFTTNAFAALKERNQRSAATDAQEAGPSSAVVSTNVGKRASEDKVNNSAEMEVNSHAEEDPPEPAPKENPVQPKVTPISIKALLDKQIARKRGRPQVREMREEKEKKETKSDTRESTNVSSKDRQSERKKDKSSKISKSDPKDQPHNSGVDNDGHTSDDSFIGSAKRRSSLRSRKEETNEVESVRHTPLRKCRTNAEGTPPFSDLPSSLKKPNEGDGSVKKHKQVVFNLNGSDDEAEVAKEVKCFFCSDIFPNAEVLETHLSEYCGNHLSGKYSAPRQHCMLCDKSFPTLNLWGLIRHVDICSKARNSGNFPTPAAKKILEMQKEIKPKKDNVSDKAKPEKVKEIPNPVQNGKPQLEDDDDVCSDEEIQVLDSLKVKVYRHEIPKPKVNEKEEKVNVVPIPTQDASNSQAKPVKTTGPVVNRALPGNVKKSILKYYERLRDCRFCIDSHSNISEATLCLTEHAYAICWVCLETYCYPAMEQHYRDCHEVQDKPGIIHCPLCKLTCKSPSLRTHMTVAHFSMIGRLGSGEANLQSQSDEKNDKKRKLEEVEVENVNGKTKRLVPDTSSLSVKNGTKVPRAKESPVKTEISKNVSQTENVMAKEAVNNSQNTLAPNMNDSNISTFDVSWGEIDEGIQDFRLSKGEKEGKASRNELELAIDESTTLVPFATSNPTDLQLICPNPVPGILEPKVKVTPALVAGRFLEIFNKETPSTSGNVVRDDNQPSTSKAALMYAMSPQMPLDYSTQKQTALPFATSLTIPKIPALDQPPAISKPAKPRGPDSIVKRNQEVYNYIPNIRSPMPGDRLYCGTIAVDKQNYRCFKVHPNSAAPVSGAGIPRILPAPTTTQPIPTKGNGEIPLPNPEKTS